jgi:hypothetical protein
MHSSFRPSSFMPQVRWLHSLTPVTYWCKLLGMSSLAACLQLELSRVIMKITGSRIRAAGEWVALSLDEIRENERLSGKTLSVPLRKCDG